MKKASDMDEFVMWQHGYVLAGNRNILNLLRHKPLNRARIMTIAPESSDVSI